MSFGESLAPFLGRLVLAWFFLIQAYHYALDWSDTTILLTDLADGWIPPGIEIPASVTLLEPGRRRGDLEALLGPAHLGVVARGCGSESFRRGLPGLPSARAMELGFGIGPRYPIVVLRVLPSAADAPCAN